MDLSLHLLIAQHYIYQIRNKWWIGCVWMFKHHSILYTIQLHDRRPLLPQNLYCCSCGTNVLHFTKWPPHTPNMQNDSYGQILFPSLFFYYYWDCLYLLYQDQTNHKNYPKWSLQYWGRNHPLYYLDFDTSSTYSIINQMNIKRKGGEYICNGLNRNKEK